MTVSVFDPRPGDEQELRDIGYDEDEARALADDQDPVDALIAELLDTDDLDHIPTLEPIIDDVLYRDTLARMNGESGSFKSFVSLDFAGCVGTGMDWHGRKVQQGLVVYVVAEGLKGVRKRVRAWEQHHDRKMTGVKFLPRPVQVKSPEWAVLTEACRQLDPALIIVDTQARVTVGVEENSATEMGQIVDRIEALRASCAACVLLVHHSGVSGERGRGSTSVKGAMQTELSVCRKGKGRDTRVTLKTGKQKDDEELSDLVFAPHIVELNGEADWVGQPITSVVLVPATDQPAVADKDWLDKQALEALKIKVAKTLAGAVKPLSQTDVEGHTPGKKVTIREALQALVDSGHVARKPGRQQGAYLHRLIMPYPGPTPSPSQPRPNPVPDGVNDDPVPVPPLKGDGGDGVDQAPTEDTTPSPILDCPRCGHELDSHGHEINCLQPLPSSGIANVFGPGEWAASGHPGI